MQKTEISQRIIDLKKENDVVILAHNYQPSEIQDIADFLGDSLDLALKALHVKQNNIVFCGVDFMAESAKILNPDKTIIHPDISAKCPMAGMVDPESLGWLTDKYPDAQVVCYVNTSAEIKALSDFCCTSANGEKVVKQCSANKIIFVPDHNLGLYIKRFVTDKEMIIWQGICPTHHKIQKSDVLALKKKYSDAEVMVHPECRPEVIDISDYVFSTNGMVQHAKKSQADEFIIGTEKEMCYRLKKEIPTKSFYHIPSAVCPNMKKITLQKLLKSMQNLEPTIDLPKDIIAKAKIPLKKMIDIGRSE
ncbi:MAG: quinolinate synthase NadA [Thermoplasmatota archaeon]